MSTLWHVSFVILGLFASQGSLLTAGQDLNSDKELWADLRSYVSLLCDEHGKDSKVCQALQSTHQADIEGKPLRVAMLGITGIGKSTLTNTLRGLKADDERASKICKSTECTGAEVAFNKLGFTIPGNSMLRILDLPGCGTQKYPRESFVADMSLHVYDVYMLVLDVSRAGNHQCEKMLFDYAVESGKPFYLVANRANILVESSDDEDYSVNEQASILKKTKYQLQDIFGMLDSSHIFLVDARYKSRSKFDVPNLLGRLRTDVGSLLRAKLDTLTTKHFVDLDSIAMTWVRRSAALATLACGLVPALAPGQTNAMVTAIQQVMIMRILKLYGNDIISVEALAAGLARSVAGSIAQAAALTIADVLQWVPVFGFLGALSTKAGIGGAVTLAVGTALVERHKTEPNFESFMADKALASDVTPQSTGFTATFRAELEPLMDSVFSGQESIMAAARQLVSILPKVMTFMSDNTEL